MLLGSQALVNNPYRDNVVLHLRGYDAQSGQVFKDYSKYNRTITVFGNTSHSTIQKKYGNSSIYFDGAGDYLIVPASSDFAFGTGDFTIELWIYLPTLPDDRIICTRATQAGASGTWSLSIDVNLKLWFSEVIVGEPRIETSNNAATLNSYNYICVSRSSGILTIGVNGVSKASGSFTNNLYNASYPLYIGVSPNESDINAYYEDLRITKGIARPIAVPTQPFPNW